MQRAETMLAKIEDASVPLLRDAWPLVQSMLFLKTVRKVRIHPHTHLPRSRRRMIQVLGIGQGPWHTIEVRGRSGFQRIEVKARRVKNVWDEIKVLIARWDYVPFKQSASVVPLHREGNILRFGFRAGRDG